MIELHNKQAIWEVTVTGTTSSGTENIEGTYFQAIKLSAIKNKDKTIDLTTAKALLKKYTNAFKSNNKNTAKSKALSEKITELKSLNQDEILVQLTANTYQTLEQFYTSTLFKSLEGTVTELNQTKLLNQIKEELSKQAGQSLSKADVMAILKENEKNPGIKKESFGSKITKAVVGFGCSMIFLLIVACVINSQSKDLVTRYINDDPISNNDNYKLCMIEKNDISNCTQYSNLIQIHSRRLDNPDNRKQEQDVLNKIALLENGTKEFNPKIYNDIETCSAKNLPDIRDLTGRALGEPTLLFRCQSSEVMKIKSAKTDMSYNLKELKSMLTDESTSNEQIVKTENVQTLDILTKLIFFMLAGGAVLVFYFENRNK